MQRGIHSQKFTEKRRKKKQAVLFLFLLCFFTISASLILLLRASFLQIKTVTVEGTTHAPAAAVSAAALASLGTGSYLHLIPFSNIFFYRKNAITTSVTNDFKEIKSLSIHRDGLAGLKLSITERTPAAIVCAGFRDDTNDDSNHNDCYLSDDQAYVFAHESASSTEFAALNHYYVPSAAGTTTIGQNFVSKDRFTQLQDFWKGALRGGLLPLGILLSDNGQYEMYVKGGRDGETTIYFDDRSAFEKTLENLLAFWQNSLRTTSATTTPAFDYINLRFGNTVYYSRQ